MNDLDNRKPTTEELLEQANATIDKTAGDLEAIITCIERDLFTPEEAMEKLQSVRDDLI